MHLVDLELGQPTFTVDAADAGVGIVMSASHLLGPRADGSVALYNVHAGRVTATLRAADPVRSAAISHDGAFVALGDEAGVVRLFRSSTGRQVASATLAAPIRALGFGADRKLHVAASQRHALQLPYLAPDAPPRPLHLETSFVRTQGDTVWWGSKRGVMDDGGAWWDAEAATWGRKRMLLRQGEVLVDPALAVALPLPPGTTAFALHPCDTVVALGDEGGCVTLWRVDPWELLRA